ncbi:Protein TRIGALACTOSYLDIACYLGLYCEROL 3, chloroplastic [Turnera subulata]|uniref:Protein TRIGALACTOSYLDIACYLGLYCEROL 3, chloroplastic n=1 Tax=Turnera subulata TaxID=218843 RepID=A0A9Q0J8F1_9ROSI|nr:Protein TRIGALACTOSYLDIACYLGLYCEROL 3, chloroplastic [Turnera subulata]
MALEGSISSTSAGSMLFPVSSNTRLWLGVRGGNKGVFVSQKNSSSSSITPNCVSYIGKHFKARKKVVCACVASPHNINTDDFSPSNNLQDSYQVSRFCEPVDEDDDGSDVLIECRSVFKSFGEKHILRGVSFKIRHGEAVGIIGPSGTGKSTILKIIAGLLAPDKGEVYIRGRKRDGLISDQGISGLRIGLVFQSAALFDSLTVHENVGFLLYENSTMPEEQISELVTETLAAVGLKGVEDRLPSELSGGMKKRVALARSIIFDTTKETIEPEV